MHNLNMTDAAQTPHHTHTHSTRRMRSTHHAPHTQHPPCGTRTHVAQHHNTTYKHTHSHTNTPHAHITHTHTTLTQLTHTERFGARSAQAQQLAKHSELNRSVRSSSPAAPLEELGRGEQQILARHERVPVATQASELVAATAQGGRETSYLDELP